MGKIGQKAWNKGKKEIRPEVLEKLRRSHLGQIAWNKGTKGIMKKNQTSFKKGDEKPDNAHSFGNGALNPRFNNGKTEVGRGYIYVFNPSHPNATKKGYIKRSRIVMEKHLGRYLTKQEVVHHKGINFPINSTENRQDDSPENLKLFANNSKHMKFHHAK